MNTIHDALDILAPKSQFTAQGTFYECRPDSPEIGGETFYFEQVEPFSRGYRRLFSNFQSYEAGETAIRTNDRLDYNKAGAFLVLSNGNAYKVLDVQEDWSSGNKQSFRALGMPVGVQYLLRICPIQNPWGIR